MIFVKFSKILFILVVSLNLGVCLYEDQVGKFDWKQKYIGKVKFSQIDLKSKLKRIFVGTESNVVAALSFKTGAILWRQILETGEQGTIRHFFVGNEIVTFSGTGPLIVRGWNPNTGVLVFEWSLPCEEGIENVHWSVEQNKVYQVKFLDQVLEVSGYHARTGSPIGSTKTITATWLSDSIWVWCGSGWVHWVNGSTLGSLLVTEIGGPTFMQLPWSPKSLECPRASHDSLVVTLDEGKRKLIILDSPNVRMVDLPPPSTIFALQPHSDSFLMLTLTNRNGDYNIEGKMVESGGEAVTELSGVARHWSPLSQAEVSDMACISVDTRPLCYILLTGEDDAAVLLSPARVIWVREEALASIITVEMLDLPVSDVEAAIEKEFASKEGGILGMLTRRLMSQVNQLQSFVWSLVGLEETGALDKYGQRRDMVKDPFGLHKIIVVVTKTAKMFGIDNLSGEIVWERQIEGVQPYDCLGKPKVPLYVQRTTRVLPHPAMWTLIFKNKVTKNSVLFVFNPINGQPLMNGVIQLNYKVAQATLVPTANSEFIKGLVLLSQEGLVQVFPSSTLEAALASAPSLYMFVLDPQESSISGYTLAYSTPKELIATLLWNAYLPSKIITVVAKNPQERVHSQGRVLGDRSVLYKYINPNLVAIGSLSQDPVHKSVLSVYLIDVVSGNIVFSVVHKRASEPIHMVHSENWVVYSYFSDKFRRTEMVTLDLYQGKTQVNSTAFSSISQNIVPFVERQAYIFIHHITAMKETITEKGITSKHVLVGLGTGGVMEVPWALLDPRRPISPTIEMREEGVIPYIPELALPAEAIITYNHSLPNIAGIHTSPAGLESTSLVFIYGLDIFYTRVAPSKTFDVLKDDFEYWLISAVLLGLTTAAYITKHLASRKALRQAWK